MSRHHRFATVTLGLLVLSLVLADHLPFSSVRLNAQDGAHVQAGTPRLRELLQERAAITRKIADQAALRVKVGNGAMDELHEPTRLAHEAALDVIDNDLDRIKILQAFLAAAKENERIASRFVKSGQGRESLALIATAERLRVEIALERAKAGKGGDPKDEKKQPGKKPRAYSGTIEAYESVRLFSRVTGILKTQKADLGDRVKKGELLAVLDLPELQLQTEQDTAALEQARARMNQTKVRVRAAVAEQDTTKAAVIEAEAGAKGAAAMVRFHEAQLRRLKDLFDQKSIDVKIMDESKHKYDTAASAENAAKAMIAKAKAQVVSAAIKIELAEADVVSAEADVKMAQLKLDSSRLAAAQANILAPLDGVVAQRGHHVGDLVRTSDKQPILTIQRTDLIRVVASIPESDIGAVHVGMAVEIQIDAQPDNKWSAKVSRLSPSLDAGTRTMRVEIDVANPSGKIRSGMFARVFFPMKK